jgi:hypothetical protein
MSFIQNFFTSRDNNANAESYVGQQDRLWWNPDTNAIYVNTANTVGGTPVTLPATANLTINTITANSGIINGNLVVTGNISPAANSKIGGIAPGPGVTVDSNGILLIDTAGLPFSFGDFTGLVGTYPSNYPDPARQNQDYAILSSVNSNEDIVLASNGTGAVRVVGDFSVRRANGNLVSALEEEPIFRVSSDGQVQMLVPGADAVEGAFTIVGGLDGVYQAPVNTGVMMHITGIASSPDPTPSRIYNDAQNSFSAIVSRRYNGTAAAPTAVLNGQEIMRLSGTAHNGTEIPGVANQRIVYKALGDQTPSNQGGTMEFLATPLNSTTLTLVATIDNANGVTATKFTTAGTVSATGNITGGNISATNHTGTTVNVTGNITGGNLLTSGLISATGNITGGNVSATGLSGTLLTASQTNITSVGTLNSLTVTANVTGGNILTGGLISATGNITGGNVTATNYTGKVTHSIRDAGAVGGTTLTLNVTTDDIVRCTFTSDFTVAFSNIVAGRVITLIATNTSAGDSDVITSGVAALNTTSAGTFTVTQQTTAVVTYYSLDGDTANIYASAVYA